jgi:CPA2 family monovalent cation:H+ antiporter-2
MDTNPTFFRDLAYVFVAAIAGGMLAWRLRQPVILGYVLAGMAISPLTPGPAVTNLHTLELFAELGVVLLMFSIGLEFSVKDLLQAKWVALIGGPIGILLSVVIGLGVAPFLRWSASQGMAVGAIISVASTMVLTRMLMEHHQLHTDQARIMIAITLVEDLAVVLLVVLIPGFGGLEASRFWIVAWGLGKAALILVPALFVASRVVPPVLKAVARTQSHELFFIIVLAICMGAAALSQAMGLSLPLGAFVAGLMISGSDYAHETLGRLLPVRDAFVALFFVTVGLLIDPRVLLSHPRVLAAMVCLIVVGKLLVWTSVVRLFGYSIWKALLVGTGLTQIGEFSYILVRVGRDAGIVGSDIYNATLAASLITILLNAILIRYASRWITRLRRARYAGSQDETRAADEQIRGHVVLCGFGRVGSGIGAALEAAAVPYIVIERDPDIAQELRSSRVPSLFGDASERRVLELARTGVASLVIVTLPEPNRARLTISNTRRMNPEVAILARAHRAAEVEPLVQAGATEVIQPEVEARMALIRRAFSHLRLPEEHASSYLEAFNTHMECV